VPTGNGSTFAPVFGAYGLFAPMTLCVVSPILVPGGNGVAGSPPGPAEAAILASPTAQPAHRSGRRPDRLRHRVDLAGASRQRAGDHREPGHARSLTLVLSGESDYTQPIGSYHAADGMAANPSTGNGRLAWAGTGLRGTAGSGGMEVLSSRILLRPVDRDRSRRFYRDVLGLAVCREFGPRDDPGVVFFLGQGLLEVSGRGEPGSAAGLAVWLQVRDVAAEHRRLAAAGVRVLRPPQQESWGLVEMWIEDPDGVRIVLVEVPADHPLRRDQR
jgi:predicted enzyme related to lactoylglutathione lyase